VSAKKERMQVRGKIYGRKRKKVRAREKQRKIEGAK
jgi:hypothetical protein